MAQQERRPFGRTGTDVGVLGFGAMELRGPGYNLGRQIDDDHATRLLNLVLDLGIDFVDTSPDYGRSEELIGRAIAGRRDEFFLASKCGCPEEDGPELPRPLVHDYSKATIVTVVERSLRRLATDHLDLVQLHGTPTRSRLEADDTIATLHALRDQGKVRFIGSSSMLPQLDELIDLDVFDGFQVPYSAMQRQHEQAMARAGRAGAAIVVRGALAQGRRDVPWSPGWDGWAAAGLDDLLDGGTPTDFMLRYAISHPATTTAIVGTLDPGHLRANVAAAQRGPLPADVYTATQERLSAVTR